MPRTGAEAMKSNGATLCVPVTVLAQAPAGQHFAAMAVSIMGDHVYIVHCKPVDINLRFCVFVSDKCCGEQWGVGQIK